MLSHMAISSATALPDLFRMMDWTAADHTRRRHLWFGSFRSSRGLDSGMCGCGFIALAGLGGWYWQTIRALNRCAATGSVRALLC
jgi:hypothetical protein